MFTKPQPHKAYYPIDYDYVKELPIGWKLLPNIAIFQERIERGFEDKELLSVTIGRGVIRQNELEKKDSSTIDKSKYLLVYPNDVVYSMRFRQGASGYSKYSGIVSPACTVLRPRKSVKMNPKFFHYMFRTEFYKNYAERYSYGIADGQIPLRYTDFKRMYSIFPPTDEQDKIVGFLDHKISAINKLFELGKKLVGRTFKNSGLVEECKQRLVTDAVTGKIDLTEYKIAAVEEIEEELDEVTFDKEEDED
jgi:type I restriction enzyme, S subunit